jgi:hypothetical protein
MKMKFVAIGHFSRSTQSHAVLRLLSVTETLHYVLIAQEIKHLVGRQNLVFLAVIGENASKGNCGVRQTSDFHGVARRPRPPVM